MSKAKLVSGIPSQLTLQDFVHKNSENGIGTTAETVSDEYGCCIESATAKLERATKNNLIERRGSYYVLVAYA